MLRIGFVEGVTPDTWARRWRDRFPREPLEFVLLEPQPDPQLDPGAATGLRDLHAGSVDMALVRLPPDGEEHQPDDRLLQGLHLIRLYQEKPVVVLGTEHLLTLLDEISEADLADQIVNDGPAGVAVETAAAGTGVARLPASVARVHRRKDVVIRPDASREPTTIALVWLRERDDAWTQEFVGVVRGRRPGSSRGEPGPARGTSTSQGSGRRSGDSRSSKGSGNRSGKAGQRSRRRR